ncbi:28S ribosomal protein S6, mitochondrial [Aplysia californica]|uniref:Small ribosomal subunit protein bS6m n=1 Tax=Aplysia californica TaxID=6500 RepID=A0ABM0K426_APLCA|nr:28S ribosomal protein S6, mitochondrial [Aplysia californica]
MPTYELAVIFRALQRPELSQAVKRCCTNILDKGGIIRGMENLGEKPLPYRMRAHGSRFYEGNYILIQFDGATSLPTQLHEELRRDTDVIRRNVYTDDEFVRPCLEGPCEFGELQNPDHEKRVWWSRVTKRYTRWERKKKERSA